MDLRKTTTIFRATFVLVVDDDDHIDNNNGTSNHDVDRRNFSETEGKRVPPPRQQWMQIKGNAEAMTTNTDITDHRLLPTFMKMFKIAIVLFGILLAVLVMVLFLSSFILQINGENNRNQDLHPIYRHRRIADHNYIGSEMTPPSVTPSKYPQQQQQSDIMLRDDGDGDFDSVVHSDKMNSHPCCRISHRTTSSQNTEHSHSNDYCLLKTARRPRPPYCSSLSSPTTRRY